MAEEITLDDILNEYLKLPKTVSEYTNLISKRNVSDIGIEKSIKSVENKLENNDIFNEDEKNDLITFLKALKKVQEDRLNA